MYCSRDEAQIARMTLQKHNTELNRDCIVRRHRQVCILKASRTATRAHIPQIGRFIHARNIAKQATGVQNTRAGLRCAS